MLRNIDIYLNGCYNLHVALKVFYFGGTMKKRIISAFSLVCATALIFDYCIDTKNNIDVASDTDASSTAIAGVMTAGAVDLASLDSLSVTDSDAVATAKSLGDIYGYTNIGICNVSEGNLNIRESADTEGKLVGKFPANAACEIVSTEGDWSYIKSGEVEGYVLSEYLLTGDEAWEKAAELAEYVATSNTGGLRVRVEPNTDC